MNPESAFTKPTSKCPHPEYWHSENTGSTEIEVTEFIAALVRLLQPEYVLETGTYQGQTAKAIGEALQANGHGKLVTLEIGTESMKIAKSRCEGLPVEIIHADSMKYLPDQTIDLAFIDSGDQRVEEIKHYYNHFKNGAFVVIHDTALDKPWKAELWDMAMNGNIYIMEFSTPRGLVLAEVTK